MARATPHWSKQAPLSPSDRTRASAVFFAVGAGPASSQKLPGIDLHEKLVDEISSSLVGQVIVVIIKRDGPKLGDTAPL